MDLQRNSGKKTQKAVPAKSVGTMLSTAGSTAGTRKPRIEWDKEIPHFGARILPSGERRWVVIKRPAGSARVVTVTLGRCDAIPLKKARALAYDAIAQLARGTNPNAIKRESRVAERVAKAATSDTFLRVARSYVQQCEARDTTVSEYQRMLHGDLAVWHARPVAGITDTDIEKLIERVKARAPVMANRLLEFLSPVFKHAKRKKVIQFNPLDTIDPKLRAKENARKRTLVHSYTQDLSELIAVWRGVDELEKHHPLRVLTKLLILTGVRVGVFARVHPGQSAALTWRMVKDLHKPAHARLEIPPELRKTGARDGETHMVPLVPAAVALLDQLAKVGEDAPVFTADGVRPLRFDDKTRDNLRSFANEAAGEELEHWTPHDLRRSVATGLGHLGTPAAVIDEILDHAGEAKAGIRGTYDRSKRVELCRVWLAKWADHLAAGVKARPEK
jgi:integrase